ncbi:hypothetical protein BC831DRAFT_472314 [Entophlyctis helioformis]|nr:hypothetical protein BC831DRAFT_472314 [Entophlyctis helioformis]
MPSGESGRLSGRPRAAMDVLAELDVLQDTLRKDLAHIGEQDFKGHCGRCKEPIIGNTATTYTQDGIQHIFHQTCFTCELCSVRIDDKAFYLHEGRHICSGCYTKKVLGHCDLCKEPFTETSLIKAGGRQFHPHCFKCNNCKTQLVATYLEKDGDFLCKACYETMHLPLCSGCSTRIMPDENTGTIVAIEWKEHKYHQACFACKNCAKPFTDLKAVAHNNNLYCKECFEDEATANA